MKRYINHLVILTVLIVIFLSSFYGKALLNPNSELFGHEGDGMKNYYTYVYYINNNISNKEFEGMNYPYMENVMYTDCHPFLAFVLKQINRIFPHISNYSVGILNTIMLLSIVLTAYILFFIFIKLKVDSLLSVLGAVAITVLSPQILRITGHYALSYSFAIPLTIYILLFDEYKNKVLLILISVILLSFFTHAYLGMIESLLVFVYAFIALFFQNILKRNYNNLKYLKLLIASIVPIIIFYFFVKILDTHTGRTTNPWGIFENHAELSTVFLPVLDGLLSGLRDKFFPNINQIWEGFAYVGFMSILGIIFYFIYSILVKFKVIISHKKFIDNITLKYLIIASVLILLFSLLLPFRSIFYEIINSVSAIKQFRAIGRFAWVFYFVINIALIFMLNKVVIAFRNKNRNILAISILIFVPVFIFLEGIHYHKLISKQLVESPNLFDIKQTSQQFQDDCKIVNSDNYQAIISLPFFYIGSENFGKSIDEGDIYKLSFLFSYHLKLPMTNSYLTRTSIYESKNIMQLMSSNFYKKEVESDLKSNKPFLIVYSNDPLSEAGNEILRKSKNIVKREKYSLYEIQFDSLFNNNANQEYNKFANKKDSMFYKDGFFVSDTGLYFSFTDFDKYKELSIDDSGGCYNGTLDRYNNIFSIDANVLNKNRQYVARFWMYNYGENYGQDYLSAFIFFQKKNGDKVKWLLPPVSARWSYQINGNWTLVEVPLDMSGFDDSTHYDLIIKGKYDNANPLYVDKLLFYDKALDIYKLESDKSILYHNNHQIRFLSEN
jgi:hypothetical protein